VRTEGDSLEAVSRERFPLERMRDDHNERKAQRGRPRAAKLER
jgi:hypothetical protein